MTIAPRAWAYAGLGLGGAVSIAANVAHSYADAEPGGPEFGAVTGAAFWPVAVFVAIEILARTPWPKPEGFWLKVKLFVVRYLGLGLVASVAAVVSYRHLSGLLTHYGEDPWAASFGPLAVDGLMVMATGALLATTGHVVESRDPVMTEDVTGPSPVTVTESVTRPVTDASPVTPETVTRDMTPAVTVTRPTLVSVPTRRKTGSRVQSPRQTVTDEQLLAAARETAAGLPPGSALGRARFLDALKGLELPCGAKRADHILDLHRAEHTNRQEA